MTAQILHGNNLDILPTLADCSVDSIVTDPPYELGFMGKQWDASGIAYNVQLWRECLRVLKPGGHLLAFGGTRTYHRMTVAIEDAGFEIRDSIHWIYGSGFPKSLDVSKAIDKTDAAEEQQARRYRFTAWVRSTGLTARQIDEATGTNMGGHYTTKASQPAVMTLEHLDAVRHLIGDIPEWVERECEIRSIESRNFAEREVVGKSTNGIAGGMGKHTGIDDAYGFAAEFNITAPATDAAKQWAGWGTALKPAHEPIVLARKPLVGTVAANVLQHGTGALNINGCRIATTDSFGGGAKGTSGFADGYEHDGWTPGNSQGRWPANVIHDGSDDILQRFPTQTSGANPTRRTGLGYHGANGQTDTNPQRGTETGSAARFFAATPYTDLDGDSFIYCPKPGKKERNAGLDHLDERITNEITPPGTKGANSPRAGAGPNGATQNFHPTVKPLALMRYLIRLITPPGGTVLEPFAGSGTTLAAATLEGFHSIGIELTADYLPIIHARIAWAEQQNENEVPTLFST